MQSPRSDQLHKQRTTTERKHEIIKVVYTILTNTYPMQNLDLVFWPGAAARAVWTLDMKR